MSGKKKDGQLIRKEVRLPDDVLKYLEWAGKQEHRGLINYIEKLLTDKAASIKINHGEKILK